MGRHEPDPVPFRDYLRKPLPFLERSPDETTEMETVPAEEVKRRTWPMALGLTLAVLAAVGIPVGVSRMASDPSPLPPAPVFTEHHSASPEPTESEPVPTVTKTKKLIEYKMTPGPTVVRLSPGPTVYRTAPARPMPTVTVTKTLRPEPRPTRTIRLEVCVGIEDGETIGEIECPT